MVATFLPPPPSSPLTLPVNSHRAGMPVVGELVIGERNAFVSTGRSGYLLHDRISLPSDS